VPRKPKMTEAEKQARKHQRYADKQNAKAREEAPLFADQVPQMTARDAYLKWRRNVARNVIHGEHHTGKAALGLRMVNALWLAGLAKRLLTREQFAVCLETVAKFRPDSDQYGSWWFNLLTGREGAYRLELRTSPEWVNKYNPDGKRVFHVDHVKLDPAPYTTEQLMAALYPVPAEAPSDLEEQLSWFLKGG
jgi:hypothetical protein